MTPPDDRPPVPAWRFRPATETDRAWVADLAARALDDDHERLGMGGPERTAAWMTRAFEPTTHRVIEVDGRRAGVVALRADGPVHWLEHFYLEPDLRGSGVGGAVLDAVLGDAARRGWTMQLTVNHGSRARRLYERKGFRLVGGMPNGHEDVLRLGGNDASEQ